MIFGDSHVDSMNGSQIVGSVTSRMKPKNKDNISPISLEYTASVLQDVLSLVGGGGDNNDLLDTPISQASGVSSARRSLYFWKNNPENNEKHIR